MISSYKTAIIGCGWIGAGAQLDLLRPHPASHAQAVDSQPKMTLVGFVDNDNSALNTAKKLYPDVDIYTSTQSLFSVLNPEIVIIATHPDTHCHYILESVQNGVKAILCEKPISHDLNEAEKVIALCKEKGVLLLVNHMRRYDELIKEIKSYIGNEYVRDTSIGKIISATADYDNGIYHGGTHIIDL
ncbi:MAG: Gfo/Idh/MocA family oxidoreductase, partial [Candidatus Margulisbacteria bacterium]|nr:Gfo/Idh/MocA family oxidoreductase [Candidatus Margulisiibacteriota bacterium]